MRIREESLRAYRDELARRRAHSDAAAGRDSWDTPWRIDFAAGTRARSYRRRNRDHALRSDVLAFFSVSQPGPGARGRLDLRFQQSEAVHERLLELHRLGVAPGSDEVRRVFQGAAGSGGSKEGTARGSTGPPTTSTSLLLTSEGFWLARSGRGRAWRLRDGRLESLVGDESDSPDIVHGNTRARDVFVLASETLAKVAAPEEIASTIREGASAAQISRALIRKASESDVPIDITVAAIACHSD